VIKRKSAGWLAYVGALLVLIVLVGVVARFTNGFTDDFKTFYIRVDGKEIMSSANGYEITPERPLHAEVKYTFSFATDENKGYNVKIVPNAADKSRDFSFTVNGENRQFQAETDLTDGFEIEKSESSFKVTPKGENLTGVLQAIYPGLDTAHIEEKAYNDMFALVVSSYNEKASVTIYFTLSSKVSGVRLDKEAIVF
jgi:hypothetical protein